jgi:hypothetical protein
MKILIPQFHPGYTTMLCKCPHEFFVRRGVNPFCGDKWDDDIRPHPSNLTVLKDTWGGPYDVAVVPMEGAPGETPDVKCPFIYLHLWDGMPYLHASHHVSHFWVFLSAEVAKRHGVFRDPRTHVIEYGLDPVEYGEWCGGGSVLAIGHNLQPRRGDKGYDNLVEIAKQIPLTLLGYGNEEIPGHDFIDNYVEFQLFIRRCSVFVNPSNWVPQSGAEMMMMGIPVVQFRPIQYEGLFLDDITCRVVDTPEQAVARIKELLADPAKARQLGENARSIAMKRFSIHRFINHWNRVFELAAKAKSPLH